MRSSARRRGGEATVSPTSPRRSRRRSTRESCCGGAGHEWPPEGALAGVRKEVDGVAATADDGDRDARFDLMGDLMLAVVALARELRVDPELALRAAADRFRSRVDAGEIA